MAPKVVPKEDDVNERLRAIDPRRRVDRSSYTDSTMPEFPALTLTSHVALRSAQVATVVGTFVWSPIQWIRGGRKEALFSAVMPRVAGSFLLGGGVVGGLAVVGMAIANKSPTNQAWNNATVDDRAYRLIKNPNVNRADDFVAAGALASLISGRTFAGKGFFGHIGIGMAWATVANAFIYGAIPELRRQWPKYRPEVAKALKDVGIDIGTPSTATTPAKGKK